MKEAQRKTKLLEIDAAERQVAEMKWSRGEANTVQTIGRSIALQQMSKSLNRLRIRIDQGQANGVGHKACTSPTFAWWNKKNGFK